MGKIYECDLTQIFHISRRDDEIGTCFLPNTTVIANEWAGPPSMRYYANKNPEDGDSNKKTGGNIKKGVGTFLIIRKSPPPAGGNRSFENSWAIFF